MKSSIDHRAHIGTTETQDFTLRIYRLSDGLYEADQYVDGKLNRIYDDLPKERIIKVFGESFNLDKILW